VRTCCSRSPQRFSGCALSEIRRRKLPILICLENANVDATQSPRRGNGANYLRTAIANEIQSFISGKALSRCRVANVKGKKLSEEEETHGPAICTGGWNACISVRLGASPNKSDRLKMSFSQLHSRLGRKNPRQARRAWNRRHHYLDVVDRQWRRGIELAGGRHHAVPRGEGTPTGRAAPGRGGPGAVPVREGLAPPASLGA
jgi:hypothetical protein